MAGGSSGSPLFDASNRIIGQLSVGNSYCQNGSTFGSDAYGKLATSMISNFYLEDFLDPNNTGRQTCPPYTPHIDDDVDYSNCSTLEFNKVNEEGLLFAGYDITNDCDEQMIFIDPESEYVMETRGLTVWNVYLEKKRQKTSKMHYFSVDHFWGADSRFYSKIFMEVISYDTHHDLSNPTVLVSKWKGLGRGKYCGDIAYTNDLVDYELCGDKLHVKSFIFNRAADIEWSPNKVYRVRIGTHGSKGVFNEHWDNYREKIFWVNTYQSDEYLTTNIYTHTGGQNVILDNSTLYSGNNIYFENSFRIQGSSKIQNDCKIAIDSDPIEGILCIQ